MIENRYISVLLSFKSREINKGIKEINHKFKKNLTFNDKLICLILNKQFFKGSLFRSTTKRAPFKSPFWHLSPNGLQVFCFCFYEILCAHLKKLHFLIEILKLHQILISIFFKYEIRNRINRFNYQFSNFYNNYLWNKYYCRICRCRLFIHARRNFCNLDINGDISK